MDDKTMDGTEMFAEVKKGDKVLMSHAISRFNTQEDTLSFCFKSVQMFDIPLLFNGIYDVVITLPGQTIKRQCMYISYNYIVFSNTITLDDGSKQTSLDCSDNGLIFRVIG